MLQKNLEQNNLLKIRSIEACFSQKYKNFVVQYGTSFSLEMHDMLHASLTKTA